MWNAEEYCLLCMLFISIYNYLKAATSVVKAN